MSMSSSTLETNNRALAAVVACGFLTALGISLVSFVLPLASLDARVSGAWLGTGMAGFFLARMLAGPFGGMWADKVGARLPLLTAIGIGAFSPLLYILHPSILVLYVTQFILGIVSGLVRPVGLAVLGKGSQGQSDKKWFSAHILAFNFALFGGPLLGGFLYWNRAIEPVLVGLTLCLVLAHIVTFVGVPARTGLHRSVDDEYTTCSSTSYLSMLVVLFGRSLGIGLVVAFYSLLLSSATNDPLLIGALFSFPYFIVCVAVFPIQRITSRLSDSLTTIVGIGLSLYGLYLFGSASSIFDFIVLGSLTGLGTAISMPSSMRLISHMRVEQGQAFGGAHFTTGAGMVLGPIIGGLILTWTHSLGLAFEIIAIVGGLCCVPFLWMKVGKEKSPSYVMVKFFLAFVAVALFVLGGVKIIVPSYNSKQSKGDLYQYTDVAMGTVVNLTLVTDSQKAADDGARKALAFMRNVQKDLDYRDLQGSVARINNAAGSHYIKPSKRAYELIRRTVELSRVTKGVFDPTIGALTTSPLFYVLDETIAQGKKGLVNYRNVLFDLKDKRILLRKKGMALDLGGIAKGAIIDATVKLLRKLHIQAGIVEAGGDFYCFGDRDWTIGIRHPRDKSVYGMMTVREKGVCGSGDYQQFVKYEEDGETNLRHHIIDPTDMEPAGLSVGVTVIAETAELADGMATALFVMGPKEGRELILEKFPDVSAMWFSPNLTVTTTDDFPK